MVLPLSNDDMQSAPTVESVESVSTGRSVCFSLFLKQQLVAVCPAASLTDGRVAQRPSEVRGQTVCC